MKNITRIIVPALLGASLVAAAEIRSDQKDVTEGLDVFNALFKEVQLNYVDTLDAKKSINNAIVYMLDQIDPYTEYYSSDKVDDLRQISTGEYGGVGSIINKGRDGRVRFSEPYEGTPSDKAGVRGGDVILKIDTVDITPKFTTAKVSELLRGTPGTTVTVEVARPYTTDSLKTFRILREKIHTPAVPYYGTTGPDGKVGYISIASFTESEPAEVRSALEELLSKGITSLVLDLQSNPGGLLESAIETVGLFVPKGTEVLVTKGRGQIQDRSYVTDRKPIAPNLPLAVLINGGSASSAEITAGALQDLDRAVIIGERSFGKGLVQQSRQLPHDAMVKITIAKYYIPSGRLIQAIDYSHRNADGSVARTPDSLTNTFKTLHGREVRDGGGITPDVKIDGYDNNVLLYTIQSGSWDVDYATKFASEHPSIGNPGSFVVTDSIFNDFKQFVKSGDLKYERRWQTPMSSLREIITSEGYMNDSVTAAIKQLENMLQYDLNRDMDHNREPLELLLADAIVSRYAYQRGKAEATLRYNNPLQEAIAILSDPKRYKAILK